MLLSITHSEIFAWRAPLLQVTNLQFQFFAEGLVRCSDTQHLFHSLVDVGRSKKGEIRENSNSSERWNEIAITFHEHGDGSKREHNI